MNAITDTKALWEWLVTTDKQDLVELLMGKCAELDRRTLSEDRIFSDEETASELGRAVVNRWRRDISQEHA